MQNFWGVNKVYYGNVKVANLQWHSSLLNEPCFFCCCCCFFIFFSFLHILALEDQLQQAKQHAEQYKSMSEANESALSDLNKVGNKLKVFSRILEKYSTRKASLYCFLPEKLVRLFLLEKI